MDSKVKAADLLFQEGENPTNAQLRRNIWRITWPVAVELFLAHLISLVTMSLVSSLGKEAVSAIGITNQPNQIPNVILQAFCVGGTAVVARCLGARDLEGCRRASEQTLSLSFAYSIFASVLLFFFGPKIVLLMGATPDYYEMAATYMRWIAIGFFFQALTTPIASLFRGAGLTRLSMYFSLIANIVNMLVGLVLIKGFGPIQSLGFKGACISQLAGKIAGCTVAFVLLLRKKSDLPIRPNLKRMFHFDKDTLGRIMRVGYFGALEQIVYRVGMISFTMYMVQLGTASYAGYNIANSLYSYIYCVGQALGVGLVSLIGTNLGTQRPDIAKRYFQENIKFCAIVSAIVMAVLLIFPEQIAHLFTREADVVPHVIISLRIMALFVFSNALQVSLCGGLRGGGDTKWPLITNLIGMIVMRMGLGYLLIVVFNLQTVGAWLTLFFEQTACAIVIYSRYRSNKWQTLKV